jgi:hypothetical protein
MFDGPFKDCRRGGVTILPSTAIQRHLSNGVIALRLVSSVVLNHTPTRRWSPAVSAFFRHTSPQTCL